MGRGSQREEVGRGSQMEGMGGEEGRETAVGMQIK